MIIEIFPTYLDYFPVDSHKSHTLLVTMLITCKRYTSSPLKETKNYLPQ